MNGVRTWLMAARPKTLTAAIAPVMVGSALPFLRGAEVLWWVSLAALASATCIQIGTNLVNDAEDFERGADDENRLGPVRVTQSGLLSSKQVKFAAFAFFGLAVLLAVPLLLRGGMPILVIGMASLLAGYAYTGGPFPLAYLGLGDLFVVVFFGLVAVGGTSWLHGAVYGVPELIAGLQVGFLATALIAINNLRDIGGDAKVGKKTMAVRLGPGLARLEIALMTFLPLLLGTYWWGEGARLATLLPLLGLPWAVLLVRDVVATPPGPAYNGFLARAARQQLVVSLLLSAGLFVS